MTEPALLRMALGLVFVIILILFCAWLARRSGCLPRQQTSLLRQIDHLSVGPRASICVVEIQGTWLVLGVTPSQISTLHSQPAGTQAPPPNPTAFSNLLARLMRASPPRAL